MSASKLQSPEASSLCDGHCDDDEDDYDDGFANNVNANRSVQIIAQEGGGASVIMSVHTLVNSNPPLFLEQNGHDDEYL